MTISLSGISVQAKVSATLQNSVDGGAQTGSVAQGATITPATSLSSGTGANQANRFWSDTERTLTSGNSFTLDVYDLGSVDIGAGAGKDALGQAWAITEVVGILIRNKSTSAGSLVVGGDGTTACWNSIFNGDDDGAITLGPGGFLELFKPGDPAYAVADSTNHLLKFAASGGDVTYEIHLLARDA